MIITCERCQTQFQLDDSRIPARGVRVRCSRCKHAFSVKPAGEAVDPVDHLVEQTLAEEEEQRAGSIQGLDSALAPRGEAEEESDWEFNDASPDPEPDLTAAREAVDDLLGSAGAAPSEAAGDGLLGADSDVEGEIDSLLDSPGDSADLEAPEPAAPEEPEAPLQAEPPAAPAPEPPEAPSLEPPAAAAPQPAADRAAGEELGSPEHWDFFSDEQEDSHSEGAGLARRPVGRIGVVAQPVLEGPPIGVEAEPAAAGPWMRRLAHAAGWLSVALLVLGGLHGGITTERAGLLAMRTAQTANGFEATAVEGHWLDNAAAGPIYVISGKLRSAGFRPAAPGKWLAVRLFDENGALLAEEAAAAGPALPEARLREEDPRKLRAAQAQGALARARVRLMPGETWAFQAILTHLPEAASRFDLAAIPLQASPPGAGAP